MATPLMDRGHVPKCILLADDHAMIRRLIRDFLESKPGYEVCGEAVDGVHASEKAAELRPDLIILDLSVPRMNGLEAARVVKSTRNDVPVILCTNYADALRSSDIADAGVSVFSKTSPMEGLATQIESLLHVAWRIS
jgi:DNA-binding NarL/FixJ family response regulator